MTSLEKKTSSNFFMDTNYDTKSLSQYSIGKRIIAILESDFADQKKEKQQRATSLLDIGCGPGNLTNEIWKTLREYNVTITGMDMDANALKRAALKYPNVRFEQSNIYAPTLQGKFDYIFSNEVLHWMPKVPDVFEKQEHVLYYFFDEQHQKDYRSWGLGNYRSSWMNIRNFLSFGGKAFLQFGLDGQLKETYQLMNHLIKSEFPAHCSNIIYPLFYPTMEEVVEMGEELGFRILHQQLIKEDLVERTDEEIYHFIYGFSSNYLNAKLGKENGNKLFHVLKNTLTNMNVEKIRSDAWYHGFFVLEKN
ncbi:class I SAM-dependent methyltransferase [Evansella tamaricis]|uniref:Class I SAM-dependent methyltransferase n=1 Tax=Evansella tamaricis TaxID=2069301 RepID=A0ABS6JJ02_9BACI|nr:class I SAM-dependent methyltransferase [Evansella tamaricis]MBU9712822.1 class I SAM-dependent methyltransferase [Evansella tamaricis]